MFEETWEERLEKRQQLTETTRGMGTDAYFEFEHDVDWAKDQMETNSFDPEARALLGLPREPDYTEPHWGA